MKLRSKLTATGISVGMAISGLAGVAGPAMAAVTDDTTTTFTLTAGLLSITAPASQDLGSVATGSASTASVQLGPVAVGDARGTLLGTWTASVASTDFKTGPGSANETIANANADYWSGAATATTGTGSFLPGQALAANEVTLASQRTAFSASLLVGNNTAQWNPTVNVNIPAASVAGVYSGTITHSVG